MALAELGLELEELEAMAGPEWRDGDDSIIRINEPFHMTYDMPILCLNLPSLSHPSNSVIYDFEWRIAIVK